MLAKAKENLEGVELKKGSATKIPYPDNYFDLVVSSEVIEHVPNTKKALKEMIRVTKPGGNLIIIDKNKFAFHWRIWFAANIIAARIRNPNQKGLSFYTKDIGFKEKWFSKKEIARELKSCRSVSAHSLNMPVIGLFLGWVVKK
jgi:ubiquinone/menaquinone biosynthesis C-methylase UbiE